MPELPKGATAGEPDAQEPAAPDFRRPIALAVGVSATVAFVILRLVIALGDTKPLAVDLWWHDAMVGTLTDVGVVVAWVPGIIGGTLGMIVIGSLVVALFFIRKRPWDAATLASAIIIVVAIGAPMAAVIARVRPSDSLAESVDTSFPSGHTAVATTFVIILSLILRRWYVWAVGIAWVLLMMWSRTYLHAHWLSDVVAGMLEGIAVATLVWCAVEVVRDRRAIRSQRERMV
ncbi:undecaprenyl-diphosphatase [Microbacterium endophyticum]|uniref:Undecaprenyl-diphosphatase n=1 Tax=Microbacterium endophyticum TaxID=1526412 RepID=A0A7W4YN21_9MICO|nr:phosphatase PAP2 family protein [Microbacterium endophyticum]MBB2975266.1 undecaprenyl-diphosphatase [Microbacterium endophyticum]NIK35715.1 undecaprenyl-diphosphatase [Microbacterium endophyticum]